MELVNSCIAIGRRDDHRWRVLKRRASLMKVTRDLVQRVKTLKMP